MWRGEAFCFLFAEKDNIKSAYFNAYEDEPLNPSDNLYSGFHHQGNEYRPLLLKEVIHWETAWNTATYNCTGGELTHESP